jgi:hypothetical protein
MEADLSAVAILKVVAASSLASSLATWGLNAWLTRRTAKKSATYSAIRVAVTLEQFANACIAQLSNHEFAVSSRIRQPSLALPKLSPYPDDITWPLFPSQLSERALTLPNELQEARREIEFMKAVEGHWEFDTAIENTARNGQKALELAVAFRVKYGLPAFEELEGSRALLQKPLDLIAARDELHNGIVLGQASSETTSPPNAKSGSGEEP